jgi:thymidine kinase
MEAICANLTAKIDAVSPNEILSKRQLRHHLNQKIKHMEQLLARLPQHEQAKVRVVLVDELLKVEQRFTHQIVDRLLAEECQQANQKLEAGDSGPLRAYLSKHLDLCLGKA